MIAIPSGFNSEEYLELEAHSSIRHEYRQGLVYAMADGSDDHSRIAINLLTEINLHLRGTDCQFFSGDVKVNYADDFFYYPDAFVTCHPSDQENRYVKQYPKLIVEVLSPSTGEFDRTEKFQDYKKIVTLEEYVFISQDTQYIECFRQQGEMWISETYSQGKTAQLKSIDLDVALTDIYRGTSQEQ